MNSYIEDRLESSLKMDVMNGDSNERYILEGQIRAAITELRSLRRAIFDLHKNTCEAVAE